jgi:hypothetical protein
VLTWRHEDRPIRDQVRDLVAAFARLRRSSLWRDTQVGGAWFLEAKWSPSTRGWHPHLHIVAEGKYLPHSELRDAWHAVTGHSYVVSVRLLPAQCHAQARYISKYVGKPVPIITTPDDRLIEWIATTSGMRTWAAYGSWHGAVPIVARDTRDWSTYVRLGYLDDIVAAAGRGHAQARRVLAAARLSGPAWPETGDIICRHPWPAGVDPLEAGIRTTMDPHRPYEARSWLDDDAPSPHTTTPSQLPGDLQ